MAEGFDQSSLDWANVAVMRASPCPFCGEKLIVRTDHHGAWLGHKNAFSSCFESVAQVMDEYELRNWNTRRAPI